MSSSFRYHLESPELSRLEANIVGAATRGAHGSPVASVVVPSLFAEANFARTLEQRRFSQIGETYDFSIGMKPYEVATSFICTVDTEKSVVAHIKRIVHARENISVEAETAMLTGLEPIDDRLQAHADAERMPLDEILSRSGLERATIQSVINVATNFRVNEHRRPNEGKTPYVLSSYVSVFNYARRPGKEASAILAYLNHSARGSLEKIGIDLRLLGGEPFHLPLTSGEGYDEEYVAVVIPDSQRNLAIFRGLRRFAGIPLIEFASE